MKVNQSGTDVYFDTGNLQTRQRNKEIKTVGAGKGLFFAMEGLYSSK